MKMDESQGISGRLASALLSASLLAGCVAYGPPPGAVDTPGYVDQPEYYYAPIYTEPFWIFDSNFYGSERDHRRDRDPHDRDHRDGHGGDRDGGRGGSDHSSDHDGGRGGRR